MTNAESELTSFIAAARAAVPALRDVEFKVRTFGGSAAMSDIIIPLILRGEKTGTFALESEFAKNPSAAPRVGDHYVVTRFSGEPVLVYRVTAIETLAFKDIDERYTHVEGPGARAVEAWRKIHWEYWGRMLRGAGSEPHKMMPVIWQRFELVYGKPV